MYLNETSFAYRMLIKCINGSITEEKMERVLKKYFKTRYYSIIL